MRSPRGSMFSVRRSPRRGPLWRLRLPALVTLSAALGIWAWSVGRRPAHATDWSSFGMDAALTRATGEMLGARFAPLWTATIPNQWPDAVYRVVLASPAVADGYIAAASYGNRVQVLREKDGAPLWSAQLADAAIASPVIDRGWLYVACLDRNLYAFRLSDGQLLWKTDLGGIVYSSPVVTGGSLLVAAGAPQPRLLRVDGETGHLLWTAGSYLLQQSLDSSVVAAAGHVIVGEADGRFHSFAFADGHHEWTRITGGEPGLASPVVIGDRAYLPVGGTSARIEAVDLASGALVPAWPLDFTSSLVAAGATGTLLGRRVVLSSLAAADGLILVDARVDDRVDTDANGILDLFRLREGVTAVDALSARVAWTAANGSRDSNDPNQIPTHGLLPTPSLHRTLRGEALAVVSSTLASKVTLCALQSGIQQGSLPLPSTARSSPVSANGHLIVATDAGSIVAFRSLDNAPPPVPATLRPGAGTSSDAGGTVVTWKPVLDFDGDVVTYQLRWDTDGEILHSATGEAVTTPGLTTWRLPPLPDGAAVTYALRARDTRGAWSPWSPLATFTAVSTPAVQVGSQLFPSLLAAIGAARTGDIVRLGTGRYPLAETMQIPAGVTVQGAGPKATVVDGKGLRRAVTLSSSSAEQPSTLRDLTVRGAATGVATEQGAHALVQNVIVRDNTAFGIEVGASGFVTVISATLFRNDVAARSFGHLDIRNSIVTENRRGLVANPAEALLSRYNDLFANQEAPYDNVLKGMGDLAQEVLFQAPDADDLRVVDGSPTTDHGDPVDDFTREPAPNGGRINMGAFAGTEQAELSQPNSTVGSSYTGPKPVHSTTVDPTTTEPGPVGPRSSGGCTLAPQTGGDALRGTVALVLGLFLARRRRQRR